MVSTHTQSQQDLRGGRPSLRIWRTEEFPKLNFPLSDLVWETKRLGHWAVAFGTEDQEPRTGTQNQEPRTENQEPRTKNQEPRTEHRTPQCQRRPDVEGVLFLQVESSLTMQLVG